jgi:hypothetical protein
VRGVCAKSDSPVVQVFPGERMKSDLIAARRDQINGGANRQQFLIAV